MKRTMNLKKTITVLAAITMLSAVSVFGQRQYTVENGTKIRVRMNNKISSKTSQAGDTFNTTVTEQVYSSNGLIVIPNGSTVVGRIDDVTPAKKGGKPGQIDVSFIELRLPNGMTRTINGSLTSLDTDKAKSDDEGSASGDKMKNRKIIFIGGGGAGGAVLGAIIGGGKGAIIGGIIGGVGGLLGERLTKGEDATVKDGTEFGVFINQNFSLPRYSATSVNEGQGRDDSPVGTSGDSRTYVVRSGDTLGLISFKMYGTASRYMEIYNANRDKLSSPSRIEVGQVLVIP